MDSEKKSNESMLSACLDDGNDVEHYLIIEMYNFAHELHMSFIFAQCINISSSELT